MIDVEVEADAWLAALPQVESLVLRAAGAALAAPRPGEAAPAGEDVVVLMADDGAVADLNARFRGQDKATNVLSFPAAPNPAGHLGDVALAFGVCAQEAAAQGKALADHVSHLVVHGVLHLLGYDHETDGEAQVMEALERAILAPLGVADPYQGESGPADLTTP